MAGMARTRLDFGILLLLATQEFVHDLRTTLAGQGFDDQGHSDGYVLRAQIVDDMERRGYVERRPDPRDGRARTLHLSERGRAALAAARRFHQQYERRMVREHGKDAVAALRALLGAMAGPERVADPRFRPMYL
jgi:hypothetical protein